MKSSLSQTTSVKMALMTFAVVLSLSSARANLSDSFEGSGDDLEKEAARKRYTSRYLKPLFDRISRYNIDPRVIVEKRNPDNGKAQFPQDYIGTYSGACSWIQSYQEIGPYKHLHDFWVHEFTLSKIDGPKGSGTDLFAQFVKSDIESYMTRYSAEHNALRNRGQPVFDNVPHDLIQGFRIPNDYAIDLNPTALIEEYELDAALENHIYQPLATRKVPLAEFNPNDLKAKRKYRIVVSSDRKQGEITSEAATLFGVGRLEAFQNPFDLRDSRTLISFKSELDAFSPTVAAFPGLLSPFEAPRFRCIFQKMAR